MTKPIYENDGDVDDHHLDPFLDSDELVASPNFQAQLYIRRPLYLLFFAPCNVLYIERAYICMCECTFLASATPVKSTRQFQYLHTVSTQYGEK